MTQESIAECIKTIKIVNSEANDRTPQRLMVDEADSLVAPLPVPFKMIYR
jgi:hypothetical protein